MLNFAQPEEISTVFDRNEAPIVATLFSRKLLFTNRSVIELFPTADSPTVTTYIKILIGDTKK